MRGRQVPVDIQRGHNPQTGLAGQCGEVYGRRKGVAVDKHTAAALRLCLGQYVPDSLQFFLLRGDLKCCLGPGIGCQGK